MLTMPYKNKQDEKDFQKKYQKVWYAKNKAKRIKQIHDREKQVREWVKNYKLTLTCSDCPESHVATLDFHHLGNKVIEVSNAYKLGWSIDKVKKEIEKCIVLCSNCHRKKHHLEII